MPFVVVKSSLFLNLSSLCPLCLFVAKLFSFFLLRALCAFVRDIFTLHPNFFIIIFYRFEIKEMTTLFWNFELLQLISAAKIRYNSQNNTTKKIRVDSLDSWLNIFVFFFSAFSVPLRENSLGCGFSVICVKTLLFLK